MLDVFGERQQELLRLLHRNKSGLTIDGLATALEVTRTAVKQHLVALEKGGYVERGTLQLTGGRPGRTFRLSQHGIDLFPKQYSWFSGLLLRAIKTERGSLGLGQHLREMAGLVAQAMQGRIAGKSGVERTNEIVNIMNELAYEAELGVPETAAETPKIEAHNCVYHHLAAEFPEVCQFDLELLARLSGADVDHQKCILRGGDVCRFAFHPSAKQGEAK